MVYSTSPRKFINMYKKPYYNWKKYPTKRNPSIQCQGGGNCICRHMLVDSAYLETSKNIYGWFLGHLHSCELEASSWVGRVWGDLWVPKGNFLRIGRSSVVNTPRPSNLFSIFSNFHKHILDTFQIMWPWRLSSNQRLHTPSVSTKDHTILASCFHHMFSHNLLSFSHMYIATVCNIYTGFN